MRWLLISAGHLGKNNISIYYNANCRKHHWDQVRLLPCCAVPAILVPTLTDVVHVDPDVYSSLPEVVAEFQDRWFRVPLVTDEHVTANRRLTAAFYDTTISYCSASDSFSRFLRYINLYVYVHMLISWLRGSVSPVLTATGLVNGRRQYLTLHRIHTP